MKYQVQLLLQMLLPSFLLFIFLCTTTDAKSMIEPCSSSDSCPSLLSYILPYDSKLSEIANRFQVNISDILAANSLNQTTPALSNQIFNAKSLVKIPISCPCVDGIRRSLSTTYTVQAADTIDSISMGYGGLVSAEQIRSTNGVNAKNPLMGDQTLVIPLPCTCFSNSDNGVTTVYMSYPVQENESLGSIAMEFGTTIMDLEAVNGLGQPVVDPGDILAIPVSACSSENLNWYNESLIVPNGSYSLTANNCIKCICGPGNLNLQCLPSGIVASCSHLQCKGSDLFIGDAHVKQTVNGYQIKACVYRGHYGRKIFRSLVNSFHVQCPGNHSLYAMSPGESPSSNRWVPSTIFSPLSSPYLAPSPTMGIDGFNPINQQHFNSSSDKEMLSQASWYMLVLLEIAFYFLW